MSRSGYYKGNKKPKEEKTVREKEVIHCFQKHKRNYGRIRVRKELQKAGIQISEYSISRILKENGLKAKSGRSGKREGRGRKKNNTSKRT